MIAEVIVKAVGVDAFAADSAVETAQTAAKEGVSQQVDYPGLSGKNGSEAFNHRLKPGAIFIAGGEDNHISRLFLLP